MQWKLANPDRYLILKDYARENRKFMTEAERTLWNHLRGNALGHKFLRQFIIGDFIVDFFCRDAQLVIEVDGSYHKEREQQFNDTQRQNWLESQGFSVLRFSNEEIFNNLEESLKKLTKSIDERTK